MPERSQRRIRSYITVHKNSVYMENFVRALGADGIFILDQIALNLGDLPARFVVVTAAACASCSLCVFCLFFQLFVARALQCHRRV